MGSKRNHHLQPNFYLKGFKSSDEENPKVWVYEKGKPFYDGKTEQLQNPKHLTTEKAARKKDFYSFLKEDGTKEHEKYEDILRDDFEEPAKPVIEKIRRFKEINEVEEVLLTKYIASMRVRGDWWNNEYRLIQKKDKPRRDADIRELSKELVEFAEEKYKTQLNSSDIENRLKNDMDVAEENRNKSEHAKSLIVYLAEETAKYLLNSKLQARLLIAPDKMSFITSDNPVSLINIAEKRIQLIFPISSKVCFLTSKGENLNYRKWKRKSKQFWQVDDETVEIIRGYIVDFAIEEIYFSQKAEWLVKFINNRNNN